MAQQLESVATTAAVAAELYKHKFKPTKEFTTAEFDHPTAEQQFGEQQHCELATTTAPSHSDTFTEHNSAAATTSYDDATTAVIESKCSCDILSNVHPRSRYPLVATQSPTAGLSGPVVSVPTTIADPVAGSDVSVSERIFVVTSTCDVIATAATIYHQQWKQRLRCGDFSHKFSTAATRIDHG